MVMFVCCVCSLFVLRVMFRNCLISHCDLSLSHIPINLAGNNSDDEHGSDIDDKNASGDQVSLSMPPSNSPSMVSN